MSQAARRSRRSAGNDWQRPIGPAAAVLLLATKGDAWRLRYKQSRRWRPPHHPPARPAARITACFSRSAAARPGPLAGPAGPSSRVPPYAALPLTV